MLIRRLFTLLFCILLIACTAAPVQEMSDARQAIESAIAVGIDIDSNSTMREAEQLITQAQRALESHRYRAARRMALDAKTKAISARTIVQQEQLYPEKSQIK